MSRPANRLLVPGYSQPKPVAPTAGVRDVDVTEEERLLRREAAERRRQKEEQRKKGEEDESRRIAAALEAQRRENAAVTQRVRRIIREERSKPTGGTLGVAATEGADRWLRPDNMPVSRAGERPAAAIGSSNVPAYDDMAMSPSLAEMGCTATAEQSSDDTPLRTLTSSPILAASVGGRVRREDTGLSGSPFHEAGLGMHAHEPATPTQPQSRVGHGRLMERPVPDHIFRLLRGGHSSTSVDGHVRDGGAVVSLTASASTPAGTTGGASASAGPMRADHSPLTNVELPTATEIKSTVQTSHDGASHSTFSTAEVPSLPVTSSTRSALGSQIPRPQATRVLPQVVTPEPTVQHYSHVSPNVIAEVDPLAYAQLFSVGGQDSPLRRPLPFRKPICVADDDSGGGGGGGGATSPPTASVRRQTTAAPPASPPIKTAHALPVAADRLQASTGAGVAAVGEITRVALASGALLPPTGSRSLLPRGRQGGRGVVDSHPYHTPRLVDGSVSMETNLRRDSSSVAHDAASYIRSENEASTVASQRSRSHSRSGVRIVAHASSWGHGLHEVVNADRRQAVERRREFESKVRALRERSASRGRESAAQGSSSARGTGEPHVPPQAPVPNLQVKRIQSQRGDIDPPVSNSTTTTAARSSLVPASSSTLSPSPSSGAAISISKTSFPKVGPPLLSPTGGTTSGAVSETNLLASLDRLDSLLARTRAAGASGKDTGDATSGSVRSNPGVPPRAHVNLTANCGNSLSTTAACGVRSAPRHEAGSGSARLLTGVTSRSQAPNASASATSGEGGSIVDSVYVPVTHVRVGQIPSLAYPLPYPLADVIARTKALASARKASLTTFPFPSGSDASQLEVASTDGLTSSGAGNGSSVSVTNKWVQSKGSAALHECRTEGAADADLSDSGELSPGAGSDVEEVGAGDELEDTQAMLASLRLAKARKQHMHTTTEGEVMQPPIASTTTTGLIPSLPHVSYRQIAPQGQLWPAVSAVASTSSSSGAIREGASRRVSVNMLRHALGSRADA